MATERLKLEQGKFKLALYVRLLICYPLGFSHILKTKSMLVCQSTLKRKIHILDL